MAGCDGVSFTLVELIIVPLRRAMGANPSLFRTAVFTLTWLTVVLGMHESRADHANIPVARLQVYHKLEPNSVTVSGRSSGAFFAHQFHVAYSRSRERRRIDRWGS